MAEPKPNYILVIVLTLVAAAASQWINTRSPEPTFVAPLNRFPTEVGSWRGSDIEVNRATVASMKADKYLWRQYSDSKTGQPLGLLVIYRKYGRREFSHRPELCYPALGWELIRKTYTTVPFDGRQIRARLVIAEKQGAREVVAYWFASGHRTEANFVKQQLRMALDRLQRQRYGWAFIRINLPVMYSDLDALQRMRGFLRTGEKPLMEALTGLQEES